MEYVAGKARCFNVIQLRTNLNYFSNLNPTNCMNDSEMLHKQASLKYLVICCLGLLFLSPLIVLGIIEFLGRETLVQGKDGGVVKEILFTVFVDFFVILILYKEIQSIIRRTLSAFFICLVTVCIGPILFLVFGFLGGIIALPVSGLIEWVTHKEIEASVLTSTFIMLELLLLTLTKRLLPRFLVFWNNDRPII